MKSVSITIAVLLLTIFPVSAQQMKVPEGCVAAEGATVSDEGYASRIIHQKTGIELVLVPAGTFTMGDSQTWSKSGPLHEVTLARTFYIGKTQVTNGQYNNFIEQSGYNGFADVDPAYDTYLLHIRGKSIMPTGDNFPIVYVSWYNAKAFCKWGGNLDLPTEAEWEYCCRAGTTTQYSFGDDVSDYEQYGWELLNSQAHPHQVAELKPNGWGIYDMHGNVWEWCLDDFIYGYEGAPTDGSARLDNRMTKVLRGSAWGYIQQPRGSAARHNGAPTNTINEVGFRVVLGLP